MNILIGHTNYIVPGGEDSTVLAEQTLLQRHGHQVLFYASDNREIRSYSVFQKLKLFFTTSWSQHTYQLIYDLCRQKKPDIAHFHNTFPLLSPAVYYACHDAKVPVVQTLHNYRLICPGALMLRNGSTCELCLHHSVYTAVVHSCYRNSKVQTLAVSRMLSRHRARNTWNKEVDRYIALTNFAKMKFVHGGLPKEKITVKPNFTADPGGSSPNLQRRGAVYVGRLSQEKGVTTLLQSWRTLSHSLSIVGDGPLLQSARDSAPSSIEFLGRLEREAVSQVLQNALFLVLPSECFEGFPLVIAEAFAHGLPVVCSRLGGMQEIVKDGYTGLHCNPADSQDLSEKCRWLFDHPQQCLEMSQHTREEYLKYYTPEVNYKSLHQIYQTTIEQYRSKGMRC